MSRCLSSSVILPPSNPSCPITPQLPCHPVPMSTAVRRALRFRSRLCHLRRGSHLLRSLLRRGNVRLHSGTNQANKQGSKKDSFVSLFLRRFFGFIYILFSFYTPPLFLSQLRPFIFTIRPPASLRLFGSNGFERQSLSTRPTPLPTKKYKPT